MATMNAPPDARDLAQKLRQRYTELNAVPTRLIEEFQTTTRMFGQEDVSTSGTLVTYQLGPNARTVLTNSSMFRRGEVGATAGFAGAVAGRFEWLRTPEGVQSQFQPDPKADSRPFTMNIKTAQLDPEMRALVSDPLATLRIFELMAESGATVRVEYLRGVEVWVFVTKDPIEMAKGIRANLQFWISPATFLVLRMAAEFQIAGHDIPDSKTPVFMDFLSDFTYAFDVLIPPGFFVLPPIAESRVAPHTGAAITTGALERAIDPIPLLQNRREFLLQQYKR